MQGKDHCRLSFLWIAGLFMLLALPGSAWAWPEESWNATEVTAHPMGLVMDYRSNAYTVDRVTGKVFCLPAGGEPIHYATIDGAPTSLAVDRQATLFVGTASGSVLAVKRDGGVFEACRCPAPVRGMSVDRDGSLLIATEGGTVIKKKRTELMGIK